jgi:hypothetical protein
LNALNLPSNIQYEQSYFKFKCNRYILQYTCLFLLLIFHKLLPISAINLQTFLLKPRVKSCSSDRGNKVMFMYKNFIKLLISWLRVKFHDYRFYLHAHEVYVMLNEIYWKLLHLVIMNDTKRVLWKCAIYWWFYDNFMSEKHQQMTPNVVPLFVLNCTYRKEEKNKRQHIFPFFSSI